MTMLPGETVYFAAIGQSIRAAAVEAVSRVCTSFVHDNVVYSVQVDWFETGKIHVDATENTKEKPK